MGSFLGTGIQIAVPYFLMDFHLQYLIRTVSVSVFSIPFLISFAAGRFVSDVWIEHASIL